MKPFCFLAIIALFISFLTSCSGKFEGGTYGPMQEDYDRIRLDHLFVIANLVTEYEQKAGHLPFDGSLDGKPLAVVIASDFQLKQDQGSGLIRVDFETRAQDGVIPDPPQEIETRTVVELQQELERVLERKVNLPVDPQRVPVNKPSVYVLTSYMDVFDVSAYLHNSFSFARSMGDFNNKIAVSNVSNPDAGIWTAEELMDQAEFRDFFSTPFNKQGYTLQTSIPD